MNQNSKYSNDLQRTEQIDRLLNCPAESGQDIVRLSRDILHIYSALGLSIDDVEIEGILGIESETDTMDLESGDVDKEFEHVYKIYKSVFEESRQKTRAKLANST